MTLETDTCDLSDAQLQEALNKMHEAGHHHMDLPTLKTILSVYQGEESEYVGLICDGEPGTGKRAKASALERMLREVHEQTLSSSQKLP